jgi:intracellular sulfur oxidation DsrE/DsrF family protein
MPAPGRLIPVLCLAALLAAGALCGPAAAADYPGLRGVKQVRILFDFRDASPSWALGHLNLAHQTFNDPDVARADPEPQMVVVFMGPSVKMLVSEPQGFSAAEKKTIAKIARRLEAMAADGIVLEVCMAAVDHFQLDHAKLLPVLERVPNGWISSAGYQAQGYALVPSF